MTKLQRNTLIGVFIGAFLGAMLGPHLTNTAVPDVGIALKQIPKCGPEGHPDTGELIIVLCVEE